MTTMEDQVAALMVEVQRLTSENAQLSQGMVDLRSHTQTEIARLINQAAVTAGAPGLASSIPIPTPEKKKHSMISSKGFDKVPSYGGKVEDYED